VQIDLDRGLPATDEFVRNPCAEVQSLRPPFCGGLAQLVEQGVN